MVNQKKIKILLIILLILIIGIANRIQAKDNLIDLNARNAKINDVLVMLSEQSGLNIVPDPTVQGKITINLKGVEFKEAIKTLTMAYGYQFKKTNQNTYLVSRRRLDFPLKVKVDNNKLSLNVEEGKIRTVLNQIAQEADIDILMDEKVKGEISADMTDVPIKNGLKDLLRMNGFALSVHDGIYKVFKFDDRSADNNLNISVIDKQLSIDVKNADIAKVLRTISRLSGKNMVIYGGVGGSISLKLDKIPIKEAIDIILSGTRFSYKESGSVYLIGDKNAHSTTGALFTDTEVIPLQYLQAEKIPSLLPGHFPVANIKVLKEQNAISVTGTEEDIIKLKDYISKIDRKIPLIGVEALIIDISHSEGTDPKAKLGYTKKNIKGEREELFDSINGLINYSSVLELPEDFYVKLQSLVKKGQVKVKAKPNITTLNGQEATINIDTVRYYEVVDRDENDDQKDVRYENVNTGVKLKVVPWVSSSGEITLKLNPSVSNPSNRTNTEGPPNINRRDFSTTVRVKDGETVVLGGLMRNEKSTSEQKVPILGDIPLLGALFRDKSTDIKQTEVVIYITPRVLNEEYQKIEDSKKKMLEKVE